MKKIINYLKKIFTINNYPDVVNFKKVGQYPSVVEAGAGYFYDEVLEYRVWIHPERGGEDKFDGDDYFYSFAAYKESLIFSKKNKGAENPIALILQKEHINELKPGKFEHIKSERIAEWPAELLKGRKRKKNSIRNFLKKN